MGKAWRNSREEHNWMEGTEGRRESGHVPQRIVWERAPERKLRALCAANLPVSTHAAPPLRRGSVGRIRSLTLLLLCSPSLRKFASVWRVERVTKAETSAWWSPGQNQPHGVTEEGPVLCRGKWNLLMNNELSLLLEMGMASATRIRLAREKNVLNIFPTFRCASIFSCRDWEIALLSWLYFHHLTVSIWRAFPSRHKTWGTGRAKNHNKRANPCDP